MRTPRQPRLVSSSTAHTSESAEVWCGRRLDEHDLVYLFLEADEEVRPDGEHSPE
jgi:hypothetical protein